MLRSTFYSFTTALRGLNVAQKQLDITGQNISNVGRPGYTRQRADVYSSVPSGYGDRYGARSSNMVGQGGVISGISQCRDPFLDIRFRREAANLGEQGAKLDSMDDLSMIFDEIEKSGLMSSFNDFVSKLQSLAGNAESSEFDSITRDAAASLVKQFNLYSSQLSTAREEKEYNLSEVTVKSINDLMGNIANLNKTIREVQSNGGPALELKDERNLLLDELSNYIKIDVKYDPKEIAGGIVVDDVTISMVGSDGGKQPLIYNDAASNFNVKVPGKDGSGDSIVTIDSSPLAAKAAMDELNDLLYTRIVSENNIKNLNKDLATMYPPPATPVNTGNLGAKLTELDNLLNGTGGLNEQIATAETAVSNAIKALNDKLADKDNPPTAEEKKALQKAVSDADKARNVLYSQKTAALKENKTLTDINKTAQSNLDNVTKCDAAIVNLYAKKGVVATLDPVSGKYTFTKDGNPVVDADGNPVELNARGTFKSVTRKDLEATGMDFTSSFDAQEFGSPGALKGALEMLNNEGVFDYGSSDVRGIGYYEKMLDNLANKLATTLNQLNDIEGTTAKENLFETSDGSSIFTAENLRISQDWIDGKHGITSNKDSLPGDNSAKNNNILLMISTISSKLTYTTGPVASEDNKGNFLDATGNIIANGRDKNGNYVMNNPDGTTSLVANKDGIAYRPGTSDLDATTVGFTYVSDHADPNYGKYVGTDSAGNPQVADGLDANGNYIKKNADGTTSLVASSDGVMYKTDPATGKPVLDGNKSAIAMREETFIHKGTFQEYLSNISNVLSLDISSTSNNAANHQTVLDSIQLSKDSISSVSLDEEGVNIMQFQKAYNAAARLMTALDEAVERIINQMGTVGR